MKNIKAIAFIDKKDKNIPSIGLLEKYTFSLKPNYIDKKNGYYKGINYQEQHQKTNLMLSSI